MGSEGLTANEMSTGDRLLAAAERILVERGVTGLSVRKVGDVAGVNPTLVTYHFKSIENLLGELAHRNLDPILADWQAIVPGMPLEWQGMGGYDYGSMGTYAASRLA